MPDNIRNKSPLPSNAGEEFGNISSDLSGIQGGKRIAKTFHNHSESERPLVSIITVVLNNEETIEQTIKSVINQTYSNIEYIIIDGGSTDGTLDIIRNYDDQIAYWLSEPDKGISDAFNKGIRLSTGEFIGILNADDWLSKDQVGNGVKALKNSSADFVFGDLLFHNSDGMVIYRINGDANYANIIHSKMPELCHPTVLARRQAFEQIGLFETQYRYAMDYEWLLRLHVHGRFGIYAKGIIGHMRVGGISDKSYLRALKEVRDIAIHYGQNRVIAYYFYIYRIIKGNVRRILENLIPKSLYHRIRRIINRRYSSNI